MVSFTLHAHDDAGAKSVVHYSITHVKVKLLRTRRSHRGRSASAKGATLGEFVVST
jgi:hypothetical protein